MTDPAFPPPAASNPGAPGPGAAGPGNAPLSGNAAAPGNAPAGQRAPKKRSFAAGQVLGAILFVLVVVFIVENTDNVKIRIIGGPKVNAPVFVALLIAAVAGALITELLRVRRRHNQRR